MDFFHLKTVALLTAAFWTDAVFLLPTAFFCLVYPYDVLQVNKYYPFRIKLYY